MRTVYRGQESNPEPTTLETALCTLLSFAGKEAVDVTYMKGWLEVASVVRSELKLYIHEEAISDRRVLHGLGEAHLRLVLKGQVPYTSAKLTWELISHQSHAECPPRYRDRVVKADLNDRELARLIVSIMVDNNFLNAALAQL